MQGPWSNSEPQAEDIPVYHKFHLSPFSFLQGLLVNGFYLNFLWIMYPTLLLQSPLLMFAGFAFFGVSGAFSLFALLVLSYTFLFGYKRRIN